ncbi:MAG: M13 family metallopeptidase [Spirochaetales bacterium]|nr:M13 family metallopeptidase [Spirochaetales bacterium]
MRRTLLVLLLTVLLLFSACQSTTTSSEKRIATQPIEGLQGSPWTNSNLYGNWPDKAPDLEDNYELNVNFDLYMKAKADGLTEDSPYTRSNDYQEKTIKSLIADTSKTSDELELIRGYYKLFSDFDKRNSDGNRPLIDYRDSVLNCNTLEELSAEIQKGLVFGDPFATFKVDNAADDITKYGVWINFNLPFSSHLESDFTDEDVDNLREYFVYLLTLARYDEDYARQIVSLIEQYEIKAMDLDQQFMEMRELSSDNLLLTLDEIKQFCTPLYDLVMGLGYYSDEDLPVCYTLFNAGVFYGIEQMYVESNIDIIKAIYVLSMAEYAQYYLDMETFASAAGYQEGDVIVIEDVSYDFISNALKGAVDQVYLEFAFPEGIREDVTKLTEKYIKAMGNRIKGESWLSESTKSKALEKLDSMVCIVVYPDNWIDFSVLTELVKDHDQFLLDAVLCRDDFYRAYTTSFIGKDVDRGNWVFSNTNTTEANAYYVSSENSINILAGILYDSLYFDNDIEMQLASIGATIGHEITHAFDTNGAKYNAIGAEENWWTNEDENNFSERAQRISDALDKIEVLDGLYQTGSFVLDEMVADLGGLVLSLDIAKEYENFNYDEFFRTYALMWYSIVPDAETAYNKYMGDNHPVDYIRANFTVQMVDEFYSTYPTVVEGAVMYLSPEDRLSVW